ncbi:MAG: hypothetical protein JWQ77_2306 [Jatrophihabitans sp.]|nr:hypothetical protein [Jatrophihabitans sp.]
MSHRAGIVLAFGLGTLVGPLCELLVAWLAGEHVLDRS